MERFEPEQAYFALVTFSLLLSAWVYSVLSSPLSKLPGPWHTKFTDAVLNYYRIKGKLPKWIHKLHEKYGPVVRISPFEASISDPEAAQQIYSVKGEFLKAQFYDHVSPNVESVFTTRIVEVHRRHRRLLAAGISETGLMPHKAQVDAKVQLAIQRMREEMKSRGAVDVLHWFICMATDIIGELSFGESFRMLETGEMNQYMRDLKTMGFTTGLRSTFPILLRLSRYVPIPILKDVEKVQHRVRSYAEQSLHRHYKLVDKLGNSAVPTLFSKLYKAGDEGLAFAEVRDNSMSYIVAGSDTTANTLTYLVWLVCKHPEVRDRLIRELDTLPNDFGDKELKDLLYMNQIIEETLRLYSAVPVGLPRVVPMGGAHFVGNYIPEGYTVSSQSYSVHRNPIAFPDPLKFNPSRWENPTRAMKISFVPWGGGSRICLGLHLARMEMRLATARFFRTFPNSRVSDLEGFSDEDMEPALFFLISPKNKRCLINAS
ncbi:cytochrome P450 [Bisporella sp. PMI_857]|nr:cytochrome P450 [Bisporella sp. PMI_857]